jgi:hypothetical protein
LSVAKMTRIKKETHNLRIRGAIISLSVRLIGGKNQSTFLITQKAYATVGSSVGSSAAGSPGQSGSNVGGVDRHLFCNMGVITPICN